jgi:hypothetical protein
MHMKTKYTLFPRGGIYYSQDSATGQQKSLRTRDEAEALQLINARNEAHRQPVLNLHLARAYAKKAVIIAPSLEDYEKKIAALTPAVAA